jgi:uncharacterized membrane protein required for colicin V production
MLSPTTAPNRPEAPEEAPDQPVLLMLGGAFAASFAFALMLVFGYRGWYRGEISPDLTALIVSLLFCVFAGGVVAFSYAYERRDWAKALRRAIGICLAGVVVLGVVAVVLALLSKSKGSSSRSSSSRSDDSLDLRPLISGVGSLLGEELETKFEKAAAEVETTEPDRFEITCSACGGRFTPVPPLATCPTCGQAALGA